MLRWLKIFQRLRRASASSRNADRIAGHHFGQRAGERGAFAGFGGHLAAQVAIGEDARQFSFSVDDGDAARAWPAP